jgi:anti-sigma regulatory factor (Ser/Thr protein kinase)
VQLVDHGGCPGQAERLIRLHHLGDSFDPTSVSPPALDGSRESGFGIYLISRSVDDVRYSPDERGRNCVALIKMLNPQRERTNAMQLA